MLRFAARFAAGCLIAAVLALGVDSPALGADDKSPPPEQTQLFESKIRPLLVENCQKCHGSDKQESGLRLDSRAAALAGGDRGPAVVPEKPEDSWLIKAVRHEDDLDMPPKSERQLSRDQVASLTLWVKSGAAWPGSSDAATSAPPTRKPGMKVTDKDRAHWAFQPIKRVDPPEVKNKAWGANAIDAFILAKLEAKNLAPNPPAEKRELIRRLTYDLTGLPPSPEDVEAFVADESPGAYEKVVDRLLASPHYGEHWARHWMDLVRYAESNSYERDDTKPHVWRYRDYLIRSFNADKPYDRFVHEQLAGDELPNADRDSLIATGYYRLGIWDDEPVDREQARYDGLDDIVATTGQVFLGLTVDCARCHDHKIDPIPQRDYYRLLSFFQNVNHYHNGGPTDEAALPPPAAGSAENAADHAEQERLSKQEARQLKKLETAIAAKETQYLEKLKAGGEKHPPLPGTPDLVDSIMTNGKQVLGDTALAEYLDLRKQLTEAKTTSHAAKGLVVTEAGATAPDTFVLMRGNPANKGDKVTPGFLEVLGGQEAVVPTPAPNAKTTGRRTSLANWLTSPDNPLPARVMANRIWQYHFGRGIVRTPSNFGTQGDRPTHPELLDWLASELVHGGWRLKPLHKRIVMSSAYRMSSRGRPEALAVDPQNDLLWRFDMRRLSAEEIRDSILAASGKLNPAMFGPAVYPELSQEVLASQSVPGRNWGKSTPEEASRRSIYIHAKRSLPVPLLDAFDMAEMDRSSPVRFSTTQPTQALGMLNSKFLNEQAGYLAERVKREAPGDAAKQVRRALQIVMCRPPTDAEAQKAAALLELLQKSDSVSADDALRFVCLMALNVNEFVWID